MKTNEVVKPVQKATVTSTVEKKRAVAKKNLPLINEAIAKYGKPTA